MARVLLRLNLRIRVFLNSEYPPPPPVGSEQADHRPIVLLIIIGVTGGGGALEGEGRPVMSIPKGMPGL